jgi:hypothetical protein
MKNIPKPLEDDLTANYQIIIKGRLDSSWAEWFDGFTMVVTKDESGTTFTALTGPVADQRALHGLLARLRDLGLTLLEVHRLETGTDSDASRNKADHT